MRGFLTINHNNLIFFFDLFGYNKKALTFAAQLTEEIRYEYSYIY